MYCLDVAMIVWISYVISAGGLCASMHGDNVN